MRNVGATMISRRHWRGPALWLGTPLLGLVLAFVIAMTMFARACSNIGQVGSSAIGVRLRNDCDRSVLASATDSRDSVAERLKDPIEIPPDETTSVSLVTNAAYEPDAYFLAFTTVGVDQTVVIREFDIDELEHDRLQLRVGADCVTLSTIEE